MKKVSFKGRTTGEKLYILEEEYEYIVDNLNNLAENVDMYVSLAEFTNEAEIYSVDDLTIKSNFAVGHTVYFIKNQIDALVNFVHPSNGTFTVVNAISRKGDKGQNGKIPKHQWIGTSLQFENPDGTWGTPVDLSNFPMPLQKNTFRYAENHFGDGYIPPIYSDVIYGEIWIKTVEYENGYIKAVCDVTIFRESEPNNFISHQNVINPIFYGQNYHNPDDYNLSNSLRSLIKSNLYEQSKPLIIGRPSTFIKVQDIGDSGVWSIITI